jgi:hypothetical protein
LFQIPRRTVEFENRSFEVGDGGRFEVREVRREPKAQAWWQRNVAEEYDAHSGASARSELKIRLAQRLGHNAYREFLGSMLGRGRHP